MTRHFPLRGDIWLADFDPVRGREQAGRRPCIIVSIDSFNGGAAGVVVVIPLTSKDRGAPLHIRIDPPEGGVKRVSFVKTEDVRSISKERLVTRFGSVSSHTFLLVEDRLRILLGLA